MRHLTKLLQPILFALALFASSVATATPVYRVSVDTSALSGLAVMDFTFLANAGATPASAVLGNFRGAFGSEFERSSGVSGAIPDGLAFGNQAGGSYLTQFVNLGGQFSFDIRFGGDFATVANMDGSQFDVTLYTENFTGFIGAEGSFASFALLPPWNGAPGATLVSVSQGLATVAEVSEPSGLLLALTGLAMAGLARGRARNTKAHLALAGGIVGQPQAHESVSGRRG